MLQQTVHRIFNITTTTSTNTTTRSGSSIVCSGFVGSVVRSSVVVKCALWEVGVRNGTSGTRRCAGCMGGVCGSVRSSVSVAVSVCTGGGGGGASVGFAGQRVGRLLCVWCACVC